MDAAVRLLDHVVHCLDKSDWPFTIEEVLATLCLNCSKATVQHSALAITDPCRNLGLRNRMEFTAATLLSCSSATVRLSFACVVAVRCGHPGCMLTEMANFISAGVAPKDFSFQSHAMQLQEPRLAMRVQSAVH